MLLPLAAAVTPRLQVVSHVDSTNVKLGHDAAADPDGVRGELEDQKSVV